ncbi:hypothetical protein AWC38_SpisGene10330 [Stylophora pistillata]|uniref:Reverse transcriptase domain-containing protein n=1 Tax=Stylophora pistillata TaxID=50429 RepID=A0A2B4S7H5_STYPI|nr:hypothetical protein AWC38_SpisGene10330 [Stylophora pistillata]
MDKIMEDKNDENLDLEEQWDRLKTTAYETAGDILAMLKVAFRNVHERIYIQTRHGADLFNASHFKAKTRTTRYLVREMLFADDAALVAHNAADIQLLVDVFARAAAQFSPKINIKKIECLFQPVKLLSPPPRPESIMVNQEPLLQSTDFTYLGSTVSNTARIDKEIRNRIGKASAAFGKLQHRLWKNKHASIRAKCKVYTAVVLSSFLYGAEVWTIYRSQVKKLQTTCLHDETAERHHEHQMDR